jgi:hypothetical protein
MPADRPDRRVALATHAGIVVLGVLATVMLACDSRFAVAQLNSDILWQQSLLWDLAHRPLAINGFQLSTNLSLVPDLALGAVLQGVLGSWRWAVFASTLIRMIGYAYAGGWFARTMSGLPLAAAALYVEGLMTALLLFTTLGPSWNEGRLLYPALFPLATLYLPVTHSGGFAVALGIVALVAWSLHGRLAAWRAALIGTLTFCIVLSDRELLLEFVVPIVIVTVGYGLLSAGAVRQNAFGVAAIVVTGTLLGMFAQSFFNHAPDLAIPSLAQFLDRLPHFTRGALEFGQDHPNQIDGLILLAALFCALPLVLRRDPPSDARDRSWLLWSFSVLSLSGAYAFGIALYIDADTYRYIEPALFLLLPASVAVLARTLRGRVTLQTLAAAATVIVCVQIGRAGTIVPASVTWQPPLGPCVAGASAKYGLHAGLAEFWTSRPLTLASESTLQVDQVALDGSRQYYTNDINWYAKSFRDPAQPPDYRFIVMRDLSPSAVSARYGPPNHIEPCGDTQLWIYDDPGALQRGLAK